MNELVIAKKYAQAFLNVYADQMTYDDFFNVCSAAEFFSENKKLLFFLSWPVVATTTKEEALYKILAQCKLSGPFKKLVAILVLHKRTFLIKDVLKQLCILYKKSNNIAAFTISSSHRLHDEEIKMLQEFLANITKHAIIYTYSIDKDLIAGIRLQSETFLWEHSIRKQLASIQLPLIR